VLHFGPMNWKRMVTHITGSFDEGLRLRNEYLVTENRILRDQTKGRLRLSDPERVSLAEIGKLPGRKALEEAAQVVRPETILGWYRQLIARKFDGSKSRPAVGRATAGQRIEDLVLQFARENRGWGYGRIVGALSNLGHEISHHAVANVLKRRGLEPAAEREEKMTWREFIRSHTEVLAAVDFFTAEVWTGRGLMTYYVLTFMRVATRQVCLAGVTTSPDFPLM
jgi:putative transposase